MKYAHLVVGFPIYHYFRNAILSVIKNDKNYKSDLLVCITGSSSDENKIINYIKKIRKCFPKRKIILKCFHGIGKQKVGILYRGNNFALEYCYKNKISILNIIQNDMQLMFWNKTVPKLAQEIFKKNKFCTSLSTGFIRMGSHPDFYQQNHKTNALFLNTINKSYNLIFSKAAIGDWGLYNINKLKKINFKFKRNETFIGNDLRDKKNFLAIYFPLPFIGVIPWPAAVRNSIIYGSILKSKNLFLGLTYKDSFLKLLKLKKIPFQEDWIFLQNRNCLYPHVYTHISLTNYLKLILKYKYIFNVKFAYYLKNNKKKHIINFFNPFITVPNFYSLSYTYLKSRLFRLLKIFKFY